MEYFMINKWKDCVSVLDNGFESCGTYAYDISIMNNHLSITNKNNNMKYYPGTFYWINTSLIKKIPIEYFHNNTEYIIYSMEALPALIEHQQYIFSSPNPHSMNLYHKVLHPLQYNHL